jgi:hypothetical protein
VAHVVGQPRKEPIVSEDRQDARARLLTGDDDHVTANPVRARQGDVEVAV